MPLVIAPINEVLKIKQILVDKKTKRHLENLGILADSEIMVLSRSNGDIIIKVKNGRLALNKATATKILVA